MKLNLIDDDGAENLRTFHEKRIGPNVPLARRYSAHLHLGLLAWRAGGAEAMRAHLTEAVRNAMELFGQGNGTNAVRRPNDFDMPLMLVLAFGDKDLKQRLADLPRENWFQPEDQEYKPLAGLFDVLRSFPVTRSLNEDEIRKVLEANRKPQAQLWYQPWIQAMGEGLLGLKKGNKEEVEQAIGALLEHHADEAQEGDWKYLVQGLMATWALVLRRFAKESGIDVRVESPYLPDD